MNPAASIILIIGCLITLIIILPWYVRQLGRFFFKGFTEQFHETLDINLDKMYDEFKQSKKEKAS